MTTLPQSQAAVPFARDLARHGDRTALITSGGSLSYRELAARVTAVADRLGPERRLILLMAANTTESLIVYLAALSAGHPLLLAPHDRAESVRSLITAYDPDFVVSPGGELDERRAASAHTLHPDLALLLSTSGSTGSPKLVRLSHGNLLSNAEAIATYLDIRADDRAATTLPMSYCYGLSVINSHLLRGAALILTDLSVTDPCFWELFRAARGSTFAGVPYTFDLLDRVGFETMRLPHLRYITQAGGRMPAGQVARYAAMGRGQGRDQGWDLVVMYGQTEATARMAYLPPDLAEAHPHTIGVPIPGGSFRLEPSADHPEPGTGELVYSGPNVMLGYAEAPADLALGRTVTELHTGDIARRTSEGLYEVIGRSGRFVKAFGLRIDPQRVEERLARHGFTACCTGDETGLIVTVAEAEAKAGRGSGSGAGAAAVAGDADTRRIRRLVAGECGLPGRAIRVQVLPELPRLPSGKPDRQAVRDQAVRDLASRPAQPQAWQVADLCDLYARILDRTDVTEDSSFVGLGGDSLSYVEMSLRLEEALGDLPADWHVRPIRDLRRQGRARRSRWRALETGVALRAVAIVLIVGSHIPMFMIRGGAHVLLAIAGYNFARFHLTGAGRTERRRHVRSSLLRILVPSIVWIAAAALLTEDYHLFQVLLLNSLLGRNSNYWFVEVIVYILIAMIALLSVPALDAAERRFPFRAPLVLLAVGLIARYDVLGTRSLLDLPNAIVAFWMFPLGWAAAKSTTVRQRMLVTTAAVVTVPGYFGPGEWRREALIVAGVSLLIWVRRLPGLGPLNRVAGLLAAGSLYIYLTHWQIYPLLRGYPQILALLASLAGGIAYATVVTWVLRNGRALNGRVWLRSAARGTADRSPEVRPGAAVTRCAPP